MILTVGERILLHLLPYPKVPESFSVPAAVTQEGIADGISIRRSHVPRSLSKLMQDGLVEEILSHVQGAERRRKAYYLTPNGYKKASELKDKILTESVRYVRPDGRPASGTFNEAMRELKLNFDQAISILMDQGVMVSEERAPVVPAEKEVMFVGRGPEIRLLDEKYSAARSSAQVVFITGETGIGKSALLGRFVEKMKKEGAAVLSMRCIYSDMFDPYMPFWDSIRRFTEEYPDFAPMSKEVKKITMEEGSSQEMLFAKMLEVLLKLGGSVPLVITVDDLQNATADFLKFVHYLSLRLGRGLIICTYNLQGISDAHSLLDVKARMAREGLSTEIALASLDRESVAQIVKRVLPSCSDKDLDALWGLSHGNPYFIIGMLGSGYPETVVMPDSLKEVVLRGISALGKKATELAEYASVIGREFDLQVLEAVTKMSESEFYERIEHLFSRRVFAEHGDTGKCGFNPPVIQGIVYASLSKPRASAMHKEVAMAIEEAYMDELEDHIFDLSRHYLAAGNVEKGVHYAEMCAERCEETLSYAQAVDYLKACISLMEKHEKYKIDLLRLKEHLAETYFLAGRYEDALKELDELLTLKEKPWDVRRKIAGVHLRRGDIDRAIDEYLAIIKDQNIDQDALARAYADTANAFLKKGDPVHALEYADKAHAIVKRTGDVIEQSHVLMLLAIAHWNSGMCETAAEYMSECISIREGFSDPLELAFSYNIMGMILADAKKFDDALGYLKKALEIKERTPDPYGKLAVKNNIALLHSIRGDLIGALKGFEDVLKEAETFSDPSFIFGAASNLGSIYLKANKPDDALRFFERAEKASEHVSDPNAKANAAYNLACGLRALKRFDDALKWASTAESRAATDEHRARFALTRCELLLESGKEFTADEMERALAVCQACGDRTILAWGHRVASRRSRKANDLEHSLTHAEEAIAISRETRTGIDLGLAYHECARTLKDMGKNEDAKRNASLALGTFILHKADDLALKVRSEFPGIEPTTPQE